MYGEGISKMGELIDLGVTADIVEKSGSWFSYNNEKVAQGRENLRLLLKENKTLRKSIEDKVKLFLDI